MLQHALRSHASRLPIASGGVALAAAGKAAAGEVARWPGRQGEFS